MISEQFNSGGHWGLLTMITVNGCNPEDIKDETFIYGFVCDLVDYIDMEREGDPIVKRFGEGDLFGFSAIQLIKTSSVTMHFSEKDNRAFIDIFSCKGYEPHRAAEYCRDYLCGSNMSYDWVFRD